MIIQIDRTLFLAAHDERIDELKETIISKDAKLSAMQNTIAVSINKLIA